MHIYMWIYVSFDGPLCLSKVTLQAERRRKPCLFLGLQAAAPFCSCGFDSLGEHSHCPSMPAGTKDLCLAGLCFTLPLRLFGVIFYDSVLSCMTHPHVLGTSQEYQVQRHWQVMCSCLPGCYPREGWRRSQCPSLGLCRVSPFLGFEPQAGGNAIHHHVLVANRVRRWFLFSEQRHSL